MPSVRETDEVGDQRGIRPLPTLVCRDARELEETLDRGGAEVVLGQLGGSCVGKPAPGSVQPLVHTSIVARIHRFVWQGAIRRAAENDLLSSGNPPARLSQLSALRPPSHLRGRYARYLATMRREQKKFDATNGDPEKVDAVIQETEASGFQSKS